MGRRVSRLSDGYIILDGQLEEGVGVGEQSGSRLRRGSEGGGDGNSLQGDMGSTTIDDAVVKKIAGLAAQEVEKVQVGGGTSGAVGGFLGSVTDAVTGSSSGGAPASGVSVEVGQEEAAVDLTVAVEYGVSIPQVMEAVRRNVINRVESLTGLRVPEVNITVNDVQFSQERPMLGEQEQAKQQAKQA